jgi:hypothetical protein
LTAGEIRKKKEDNMTTEWQTGFFDRNERLAKLDKLYDILAEFERVPSGFVVTCRVPDGWICEKRQPLFMARKIMLELFKPLKSTKPIKS